MTDSDGTSIAERWELMHDALNEHQRRIWLGVEARVLGRGGVSAVASATGASRSTVIAGCRLAARVSRGEEDPKDLLPRVRVRSKGGGRTALLDKHPELWPALLNLVEPDPLSGQPSPLLWTTRTRSELAERLAIEGISVSESMVHELLRSRGFRVRTGPSKVNWPSPEEQFKFVSQRATLAQSDREPVIGLELFRVTRPALTGEAPHFAAGLRRRVDDRFEDEPTSSDSSDPCEVCGATKYNAGLVDVPSAETVDAVPKAILQWWETAGAAPFHERSRLTLIVGGLWGNEPAMRRMETHLLMVCRSIKKRLEVHHLPAGVSRWRRIVSRFSMSTNNYIIDRSLDRHEVVLELPGDSAVSGRHRISEGVTPFAKSCVWSYSIPDQV
jgi:Rhodopirellula transposase DDE domain